MLDTVDLPKGVPPLIEMIQGLFLIEREWKTHANRSIRLIEIITLSASNGEDQLTTVQLAESLHRPTSNFN